MKVTGLNNLDKLIRKFSGLEDFIQTQADIIIGQDKKILEDDNRKQLNFAGIGSDGNELTYLKTRKTPSADGIYSNPYSKYKERKGGQTSFVNLRLTGDFQKTIELFRTGIGEWTFTSTDVKYEWLKEWYGENIVGVTEDFLKEFSEDNLQPQLQNKVDNYLK